MMSNNNKHNVVLSSLLKLSLSDSDMTCLLPSLITSPCRLDSRVEGQQVGLVGNRLNGRDNLLDILGLGIKLRNQGSRVGHLGGDLSGGIHRRL